MRKILTNKCKCVLVIFTVFCLSGLQAQQGYTTDSLQIKVYTEIDYVNNSPKAINIKKVFCDYCSSNQLMGIEDEALRRSYIERNLKKNKLVNGKKKLAIYIRIAKSDFAYLENNQEMSLEHYLVKNMDKNVNQDDTNTNNENNKSNDTRVSSN